jgi:hypothetical protein
MILANAAFLISSHRLWCAFPQTTHLHMFAVVTAAITIVDVVPLVTSASCFAVLAFIQKPTKWAGQQNPKIRPPSIRLLPIKKIVEHCLAH